MKYFSLRQNGLQFILFWCCLIASNASQVEILIPNGQIIGEKFETFQEASITRFLGIPYAKPPLGKLRFRKPAALDKWDQPVRALSWPNNCIQIRQFASKYASKIFSEDCLYLNIWSPNVIEANARPVLVWIHGGALIFGTSTDYLFDLETLAVMADAVVVSINYRLSALGFLYSDQMNDVPGNQGFWDQTHALKWVKDNIRYFGGDPNRITILGDSAGSWSVSAHILSPVSRDLFHSAIMMSGSITFKAVLEPKQLVPRLLTGIRAVGCATVNDSSISSRVIECLEQLDADTVDRISFLMEEGVQDFNTIAAVDGEFLPFHPNKMLTHGQHKKNFNLLVSTVEDEGSFLFYIQEKHPGFRKNSPTSITLEEAVQHLLSVVGSEGLKQKVDNETISKVYFSGLNAQFDNADLFRKQAGIAYGDLVLACPTIDFARKLYTSSPESITVYQWHYKAKIGNVKELCSSWGGACHVDDLYPAFGDPFRNPEQYHNRERELSREIISFFKSFLYHGNPGKDQSEWNSYFMINNGKDLVAPYYEINNNYKSPQNFKFNLKQLECQVVWGRCYK